MNNLLNAFVALSAITLNIKVLKWEPHKLDGPSGKVSYPQWSILLENHLFNYLYLL